MGGGGRHVPEACHPLERHPRHRPARTAPPAGGRQRLRMGGRARARRGHRTVAGPRVARGRAARARGGRPSRAWHLPVVAPAHRRARVADPHRLGVAGRLGRHRRQPPPARRRRSRVGPHRAAQPPGRLHPPRRGSPRADPRAEGRHRGGPRGVPRAGGPAAASLGSGRTSRRRRLARLHPWPDPRRPDQAVDALHG